jgi:hypothetical protein
MNRCWISPIRKVNGSLIRILRRSAMVRGDEVILVKVLCSRIRKCKGFIKVSGNDIMEEEACDIVLRYDRR